MKPNIIDTRTLIESALHAYNKLILIVGIANTGKTSFLVELSKSTSFPLLNLNFLLSEKLLSLNVRQRKIQCQGILQDIIDDHSSKVLIFDNIELLFDTTLSIDPIRALESISRNKCIVVSWPGIVENNKLIYADQNHPEYKSYPVQELLIVSLNP